MKLKIFELSTVDITLYKFVLPLMKELKQNNFTVICGARNYGYLDKLHQEGFKTYNIPLSRSLNPLALLKSLLYLIQILKKEKIDILHVHTPIASFIGRLAAFFAKVDIKIYTVHGFILKPKVFYYVEKFLARTLTDYIFTVNQEDLEVAVKNNFISASKVTNINSVGIDIKYFNPERISVVANEQLKASLNVKNDIPIIGYVGRVVKSKGVLDLIYAFVNIRKEMDCKLLLVGPWDFNERPGDVIIQDIRRIIDENQLEQDIILLGNREDIAELLNIMDVFVLPSYREGMPVSLLEAMSMKKAVIGTNIRGIREEITSESGIIYEPGDVNSLQKSIVFYLKNHEEAVQMGIKARQRVVEHFSMDKVIEKQMKVFLELLNNANK